MRYFSTFEIAKRCGVHHDTLKDWVHRGFVEPDRTEVRGSDDRVFRFWTKEGILKIRKFKDLVNLGLSRSLASRIVYGAMDRLESEYFTIVLIARETASPPSGQERRGGDVDESIADNILYAVAHNPDGSVELSVFEAGRVASVTLSRPMAAQLAEMLTSDRIDPYPERFIRFLKDDIGLSDPQIEELQRRFGEALVRGDANTRRQP